MTAVLKLTGVSKRFGKVQANKDVSVVIEPGAVHAIVGENGAGKSTLMKIAYGLIAADDGAIEIKGKPTAAKHTPRASIERGLGMVHQHFMLVPPLSVVENIVIGREPRRGVLIDLAGAAGDIAELSKQYGFEIDPHEAVENLSVGEQQWVEILKVLWRGCDILILDEPTAVLTPAEVERLFEVLRGLVAKETAVVIITHKLDEVVEIADHITVMRRGVVVDTLDGNTATPESIARAMVGRPVLFEVEKGDASPGDDVLRVSGLTVTGRAGRAALEDVSLSVREREIVGVAGVLGNGQSELCEAIVGLAAAASGTVTLVGQDVTAAPVRERHHLGLAHVPEDRHHRGLVLQFSTAENLILGRQRAFASRGVLDRDAVAAEAERAIESADIRPTDPDVHASGLSGGNQQKVVISRELAREPLRLLVCSQPTRGVDIGAIEQIHRDIIAARDNGLAVLLISSELSELLSLSDRLLVMYGGHIVAELSSEELALPNAAGRIGEMMTGAAEAPA